MISVDDAERLLARRRKAPRGAARRASRRHPLPSFMQIAVILGPFRFINHDCKPNCQIEPIIKTHASRVVALFDIEAGETITIAYTSERYYRADEQCRCASCNPEHPPIAPRHVVPRESLTGPKRHRRRNRGRGRGRKKHKPEEAANEAGEVEEVDALEAEPGSVHPEHT
ncbi:hypothetical protein BV25DRAFT_369481 [Artomyces pyxidatus]|uniref:Uncharacterized protein n=1 Tax=Artomyces pyxidatus TaxID=48021 RepID=A0ACB8T4X3_9AGAM|nr:hypothetical protein BV25DRAFT_369481 [Artomyces pyxidatus]